MELAFWWESANVIKIKSVIQDGRRHSVPWGKYYRKWGEEDRSLKWGITEDLIDVIMS